MNTTTTREKSARARAVAQQQARRRRLFVIVGSTVAVLAVVAVIVLVSTMSGGSDSIGTSAGRTSGDAAYRTVASVPQDVLDEVGTGDATAPPQHLGEPALTQDGKPLVLYVGAEYCPYCAAQRWAFVQAMSRFGTFSDLDLTTSAAEDVFPNTPTFTFHGSDYTSKWLAFTGKELYTNEVQGDGYVPLDTLTPEEEQIFSSHTQSFPFIDVGGHYAISGSTYKPDVLEGLTAREISNAMLDAGSPVAQSVDGAANVITAAICRATDNKPVAVCTAPAVTAVTGS